MSQLQTQKNSLSVLHIFSGDLWAGAEVVIFNLLRRLSTLPMIKIIALSMNEGILTQKLRETGIECYVIPESNNSFGQLLLKAARILKNKKVDIIHCHRYKENVLGVFLSFLLKPHGLVATIHGLPEHSTLPKTRLLNRLNFFILKTFFSKIIAVSNEMKQSLLEKYNCIASKIQVIHNGIEISNHHCPLAPRKNTSPPSFHIGTVGRMVPIKDYDLFLSVACEIKNHLPSSQFSILGNGPLKSKLKYRAQELGMDEHSLRFLDPTPNPSEYYRSLDLYLNTSLHEGIPLSILEAMSFSVPVVAPRVGGIPEIIIHEQCGYLVSERNPKVFADYCLRLLYDHALRYKFGEEARKRVALFSASKMAEGYFNLYQSLSQLF